MGRSPQPLAPEAVAGQDVVPEVEDTRLLELLRAQVGTPLRMRKLGCPVRAAEDITLESSPRVVIEIEGARVLAKCFGRGVDYLRVIMRK